MARCPPRVQCRGVIPPLSHIMLQSDPLAVEFNEILNGVEIFAPFQPLDQSVTFYAPLHRTVRDLRLNQDVFTRASDAWFKDINGIYRKIGINQARFEERRLLMEPAGTNKCENYNANPDPSLTGLSAPYAARVFNPDLIRSKGLQDICPNGYLFEFYNNTGASIFPTIAGAVGNLNIHTVSMWVHSFGDNFDVGMGSNRGTFNTSDLEHITYTDTGVSENSSIQFRLLPGVRVHFILNQLEESRIVTSPIVTEGTAGQRAIDLLRWDESGWFNDPEGMVLLTFHPRAGIDDIPIGDLEHLVGVRESTSLLYQQNNQGPAYRFYSHDQSTFLGVLPSPTPAPGDVVYLGLHWSGATFFIGARVNDDPWVWNNGPYSGDYTRIGSLIMAHGITYPAHFSELFVYNEDKGSAWIEANYP